MYVSDSSSRLSRRRFCALGIGAMAAASLPAGTSANAAVEGSDDRAFRLNYILSAAMYGTEPLADVLDQVKKTNSKAIDVWPMPHGNHREQIDKLGLEKAETLFREKGVQLGSVTRYDLGPGRFSDELAVLQRFGGKLIVTGSGSHPGETSKDKVRAFVESMKRDVDKAGEHGITIGIENHSSSDLDTPDAVRYFAEMAPEANFGLAMAPYHLPQIPEVIAKLIEDLGPKVVFFQAWEHGMGCMKKMPRDEEMMQMPGRGKLDFAPILAALRKINYAGWTEIFMHPTPRGIPVAETTADVTAEINFSRMYLEHCLARIASS